MKKKVYRIVIPICLILIFIILILLFITIYYKNIIFYLIGDNDIVLNVNEEYKDKGFISKLFGDNISNYVDITSNLNNNIVGKYKVKYELNYKHFNIVKERNIIVRDNIKPSIELKGNINNEIYIGEVFNDPGVIVNDNYDKDLLSKVVIDNNINNQKEGNYRIIYTIKDSSNNENSITRNIKVKKKIIRYNGNEIDNVPQKISNYIKNNNLNVCVGYYDINSGKSFYYNKNKLLYGASLIKTLDALYLYDNNMVTPDIEKKIENIIINSDNNDHLYLVNYIGRNNLINYGKSLGAKYTLYGGDIYGLTNVSDQIIYYKKLYEIIKDNPKLKNCYINSIGNHIKINGVDTLCKYGLWDRYFHNSGIVLDKNPYIVVVLTEGEGNTAYIKIRNISKLIYEYHINN